MTRIIARGGVIFLLLALIGCGTPYQSVGFIRGGFSEVYTGPNTATINFRGNSYTGLEKARRYALRRAAEVTIARGYDYFLIEGEAQNRSYHRTPDHISCNNYGFGTTCQNYGGTAYSKPRARFDIRMYRGNTPNEPGFYNATFLVNSLGDG